MLPVRWDEEVSIVVCLKAEVSCVLAVGDVCSGKKKTNKVESNKSKRERTRERKRKKERTKNAYRVNQLDDVTHENKRKRLLLRCLNSQCAAFLLFVF